MFSNATFTTAFVRRIFTCFGNVIIYAFYVTLFSVSIVTMTEGLLQSKMLVLDQNVRISYGLYRYGLGNMQIDRDRAGNPFSS